MHLSVGIPGTGWVGARVAISVLHAAGAGEVLLSDVRGEVGEGVGLSLPCVVDVGGAVEVVPPELAPEERTALERSAGFLRDAMRGLD